MRRGLRPIRSVLLLIGALLPGPLAAGEPDPGRRVTLTVQSGFPFNLPVLGEGIRHFRDLLAADPGSDLRVRVYEAGKLVPTLQIFDAVAAGRLDAGFAWPGYWMGKLPATTVFAAVPFGPGPDEYLSWIHEGGGLELWRRLYEPHGAVPIPCGVLQPEASGWFRRPIESPEDLRGLKVRYAGLGGKVLGRMGASITMLAAGDIFVSLERGVLDATEFSMPATDRPLGFYKVAKHYYFPGWHQPSSIMELVVHKDTWESLSEEQRGRIEMACNATTLWMQTRGIAAQAEAMEFYRGEGVVFHEWSPEMLARFRELTAEVMAEAAAADPAFAEAWASLQAFRERAADWSDRAFVD